MKWKEPPGKFKLNVTTVPVIVSSLPHTGTQYREGQERDLKVALRGTDPSIPLVFVSGNHDLGNTPTPETAAQFCNAWGDDYFSFWVGG